MFGAKLSVLKPWCQLVCFCILVPNRLVQKNMNIKVSNMKERGMGIWNEMRWHEDGNNWWGIQQIRSIEDGRCRIWAWSQPFFGDGVLERTDIVLRCWKCMIEPAAGHSSHCPSEVGAGVLCGGKIAPLRLYTIWTDHPPPLSSRSPSLMKTKTCWIFIVWRLSMTNIFSDPNEIDIKVLKPHCSFLSSKIIPKDGQEESRPSQW